MNCIIKLKRIVKNIELYRQVKADREKHPGDDGSQISTMIFVTTN